MTEPFVLKQNRLAARDVNHQSTLAYFPPTDIAMNQLATIVDLDDHFATRNNHSKQVLWQKDRRKEAAQQSQANSQ